jgi:hypothetical protein
MLLATSNLSSWHVKVNVSSKTIFIRLNIASKPYSHSPSIICAFVLIWFFFRHPKFENNVWVHDMIIHPKIKGVFQVSAILLNHQTSD